MMRSATRNVLLFVVAAAVTLPVAWFYARPSVLVLLCGLVALNVFIWTALAAAQLVSRIRFGASMTFDEILNESDPVRRLRLIRYHLGWSPAKIAGELNRRGVTNQGLPWREDDVRRAVKRVGRVM